MRVVRAAVGRQQVELAECHALIVNDEAVGTSEMRLGAQHRPVRTTDVDALAGGTEFGEEVRQRLDAAHDLFDLCLSLHAETRL